MLICFEVGTASGGLEFTDVWGRDVKLRRWIYRCFHLQRVRRKQEVSLSFYTKVQDVSFIEAEIFIYQNVIGNIAGYNSGAHFTDCTLNLTKQASILLLWLIRIYLFMCEIVR
jgi:hypothetical protein